MCVFNIAVGRFWALITEINMPTTVIENRIEDHMIIKYSFFVVIFYLGSHTLHLFYFDYILVAYAKSGTELYGNEFYKNSLPKFD